MKVLSGHIHLERNSEAYFPGRLQPPHKGHKLVDKWMDEEFENHYIGVADLDMNQQNPLTAEETIELLEKADFYGEASVMENPRDLEAVQAEMEEKGFPAVVTGNPSTRETCESLGFQVVYIRPENRGEYRGSNVRDLLRREATNKIGYGGDWERLVPEETVEDLRKTALQRIKKLDTDLQMGYPSSNPYGAPV